MANDELMEIRSEIPQGKDIEKRTMVMLDGDPDMVLPKGSSRPDPMSEEYRHLRSVIEKKIREDMQMSVFGEILPQSAQNGPEEA